MSPEQAEALVLVPESLKATFSRAFEGDSRAAAIKAFCAACTGFNREQVRNCTAKACPLYPYRPYVQEDSDA